MCCKLGVNKGELVETYAKFGDVAGHFDKWWSIRGQYLFTEQERPKKVSKISKYEELDRDSFNNETLILKIPLTLRKQTVTRRIGKILKDVYEGREVDIYKASTAKVVRIKKNTNRDDKAPLKNTGIEKALPKRYLGTNRSASRNNVGSGYQA